ncbi:TonB-dependent receptor plug domain-containing protein, partial [Sphingomonas adhaesiva]
MTRGRTTATIGAVAARGVALTAAIGVAGLWSAPIAAQRASPRRVAHDIPAGPLDVVLRRLAVETDEQILVDPALVVGRRAPPLARGLPVGAALDTALAGHPLVARRVGPGVLVIERVAAPDAGDWAATPADIVVTAERRPTLLSAAAPSLAVISAATLEETRTVERRALARLLPALTATNTGPLQQRLSVRGVIGTGEGTVGVYYGEVPVTAPSGTGFDPGAMTPDVDLIDVERIELLKGPQGTLYGASSLGGTLRTLFRQADAGGFAADGAVELGTTRGGGPSAALSAMVNVPVVADRLAVRVV